MTKRDREHALLMKLQNEHGYMFGESPRKSERTTMHFRGDRKTGKYSLVAARVMSVSTPASSWLATQMDKLATAKPKKRRTTTPPHAGGLMSDKSKWSMLKPDDRKPWACDLCSKRPIWKHPAGGFRCGKCPRPDR